MNRQAIDAGRYWEADKRDVGREIPLNHDSRLNGAELGLASDSATPAERAEAARKLWARAVRVLAEELPDDDV